MFKFVFLVLIFSFVLFVPISKQVATVIESSSDLKEIKLEARSAFALDLVTGKIFFEKNIHESLPLASITKIISSLVVADHLSLNEFVEVSKSAIATPEPSTLRVGEHLRVQDLLTLAMGESSNDAMTALVEHFGNKEWLATSKVEWFLELMHQKARELGAKTMSFLNPTGLDIEHEASSPSNFGSAWDLAQVVKNSLDSIIWQLGEKEEVVSQERIVHNIRHTNTLKKEIPGIFGAKTGFTDSAGGNLVLVVEKPVGKPKLIIILGSTLEARFEDAKKLLEAIF